MVDHPFNRAKYGYPAYDYDCWFMHDGGYETSWWNSAWYTGYWSYWTAVLDGDDWMYSGTGFSGRKLSNNSIDAWSFTQFEKPGVGGFGEGTPPAANEELYSYRPASSIQTSIQDVDAPIQDAPVQWFDMSGRTVSPERIASGLYIRRQGNISEKVLIK